MLTTFPISKVNNHKHQVKQRFDTFSFVGDVITPNNIIIFLMKFIVDQIQI